MITETKNHRLITQLIDESFSVSNADVYNLYIALSKHSLRFGAEDIIRHKIVLLEDYALSNLFNPLQVVQEVRKVMKEHAFFNTVKWHRVRVAVKNQKFTFLPGTLFEPEAATAYLELHTELDEFHERVFTYHHPGTDMVAIYATDQYLPTFLSTNFQPEIIQIRHQTSALIETLLHITERTPQKKLYAYVEQNYITLIVINDGNLEFCNMFYYASPEDFIYYIVLVMQEQKLNPEVDLLTVWGDILHDSDLFDILRTYIRHVQLGKKTHRAFVQL